MNTNFDARSQNAPASYCSRNRVLRNTYMLLGLSMVPTVSRRPDRHPDGFQLLRRAARSFPSWFSWASPLVSRGIEEQEQWSGVALLLGFTFFMGLMLSASCRLPSVSPMAAR